MTLKYNVRGAEDIRDFHARCLVRICAEIEDLERELKNQDSSAARLPIAEALTRAQLDRATTEGAIAEMEQHLSGGQR
jgi:hypothetical protein